MTLKEIIKQLEEADPKAIARIGFKNPHSFRGFYGCLAFEPATNVTVQSMLDCAKEAWGSTYTGWKGGEYTMNGNTDVYLAYQGSTGDELSESLMMLMLIDVQPASNKSLNEHYRDIEKLRKEWGVEPGESLAEAICGESLEDTLNRLKADE